MPSALIGGGILGFLGGLVLAGLVVGIGVPVGPALGAWWNLVFVAVWLGGGALLGALSWRGTGLRFEDDHIVVARPTGLRGRIAWQHVESVNVDTSTNEDGDVIARWLTLTVLRHPELPVPPMPAVFGEFRVWRREYFRTVRLGVPLPVKAKDARGRFSRQHLRTRRIVREELTARGFDVPE
jgi:hypothetical protein